MGLTDYHRQIEHCARIAHEANKAYCESIGDFSQPVWDDAPQWQKDSVINGVQFHFDNRDAPPWASHENWLKEKMKDGWVYGVEKNVELKTHPCMLPYQKLPASQRFKDLLFMSIVHSYFA